MRPDKQVFIDIDGFKTEVLIYNSGNSAIIVGLHGFAGSARTFKKIAPKLPKELTFYSFSLPWHGETESSYESKLLSLESYADGLVHWINSIQPSKIYLIAHSFGARIASAVAIRYPSLISQMFYLAPGGFYPWEDFMFRFMGVQPFRYLAKFDIFVRPYAKFMIPGMKADKEKSILYAIRKMGWSFPGVSLRKNNQLIYLRNYRGKLNLIMGENDHLLPSTYANKIASYWNECEIIILKKCGHLPMVDSPSEVGSYISERIKSEN